MTATYTKLKDGSWGVRVTGTPSHEGRVITVTKKDGSAKQEALGPRVWEGNGVQLLRINSGYRATKSSARRTGCSCGSLEGVPRASDCWTCRHDAY